MAEAVNEALQKVQNRVNKKRKPKAPFEDGSGVLLLYLEKVVVAESKDAEGAFPSGSASWGGKLANPHGLERFVCRSPGRTQTVRMGDGSG